MGDPDPPVHQTRGVTSWQTTRPFWWGLLLLMDRDASDVPELTEAVVSQSAHGLAVKVLHARDVDLHGFESDEVIPPAKVQVDVLVGDRPRSEVLSSGVIDVPSGVLTLGDAEHEDALEIGPRPVEGAGRLLPTRVRGERPRVATAHVDADSPISR